jgi:hypothetical protein
MQDNSSSNEVIMRTLTLPSGRIVKVGLKHTPVSVLGGMPSVSHATVARVELENEVGWTAYSYCSKQDQFVKRLGRLYVARRMNKQLAGFMDRADRKVIFNALYAPKPKAKPSKSEG